MNQPPANFDYSLLEPIEGSGDIITGLRLERVADIIEAWPTRYLQETYGICGITIRQNARQGLATECDSARCVAGWAPSTMPVSQIAALPRHVEDIDDIACRILGMTLDGASRLFNGGNPPKPMPMVLRRLAKMPEADRDHEAVMAAFEAEGWEESDEDWHEIES